MLNRRSFIGAASGLLSLVGLKLPQAKAISTGRARFREAPQDGREFAPQEIASYESKDSRLLITGVFLPYKEMQFVLPHRYALKSVSTSGEGDPREFNLGRRYNQPLISLVARHSYWQSNGQWPFVFHAGDTVVLWSDQEGPHGMCAYFERF